MLALESKCCAKLMKHFGGSQQAWISMMLFICAAATNEMTIGGISSDLHQTDTGEISGPQPKRGVYSEVRGIYERQPQETTQHAGLVSVTMPQALTPKQLRTEDSLKDMLTKLKRRPQWRRCDLCEETNGRQVGSNDDALSSKLKVLGSKVRSLERWKAVSTDRIERLEEFIQVLQAEREGRSEQLEYQLMQPDIPDDVPDALIGISDERMEFKRFSGKAKRDASPRSPTSQASEQSIPSESEIDHLSSAVTKLNKTVHNHEKLIYKLFARLGRTQKYIGRRFGALELKTKRAQKVVERTYTVLRAQKVKIDTITEDTNTQKTALYTLQSDILNFTSTLSQENTETTELLNGRLDSMNATVSARMDGLASRIENVSATASATSISSGERIGRGSSNTLDLANLKRSQDHDRIAAARSVSKLSRRLFLRERQLVQLRGKMRQLAAEVLRQKQVVGTIEEAIESKSEAMENRMDRIALNISELQTNSMLLRDQQEILHSTSEISLAKIENVRVALRNLTLSVDKYCLSFDKMNQEMRKTEKATSKKMEEAVVSLNVSFNEFMAKSKGEISFIKTQLNVTEDRRSSIMIELATRTDAMAVQTSELQRRIIDDRELVIGLSREVHANLSNIFQELRNSERKNDKKISQLMEKVLHLDSTLTSSIDMSLDGFGKADANLTAIWKKFELFHEMLQDHKAQLRRNSESINETKLSAMTNNAELSVIKGQTESIRHNLQQLSQSQAVTVSKQTVRLDAIEEECETQSETLKANAALKFANIAKRLSGLEIANESLHRNVQNWADEIVAVKGGVKSLRKAERAVSVALSTYGSTVAQHGDVQRNLTKISQKVRETLQGHGLALKSIQDIMKNLNQSWAGEQIASDVTYAEEIASQGEDIHAMRSLMQNFSSLLTEVLNDQLSQGVLHATLSARQKSITEKLDYNNAQIVEVRRVTAENTERIEFVNSSLTAGFRRTKSIVRDQEIYGRELAKLDNEVGFIRTLIADVNFTRFSTREELYSWTSALNAELAEFAKRLDSSDAAHTSLRENQAALADAISQDIGQLKKFAIDFEAEMNKLKQQQVNASANFKILFETRKLDDKALRNMNFALQREILDAAESINQTRNFCRDTAVAQSKSISEILMRFDSLPQNTSNTLSNLDRLANTVGRLAQSSRETQEALAEVRSNQIKSINRAITDSTKRLVALETEVQAHDNDLVSAMVNDSNIFASLRWIKESLSNQEARIIDLVKSQSEDSESKRTFMDDLQHILDNHNVSVSEMENRMLDLSRNIDYNYNLTQLLFELLDGQEERMTILHDESADVMPSITSFLGKLDLSLTDMNSTLRYDIDGVKDILRDLQGAFDTTNEKFAMYVDELNVVRANSTNQFDHLSTSTEYLTQIVHETDKAVEENRARVDAINETVLTLRLFHHKMAGVEDEISIPPIEEEAAASVSIDDESLLEEDDDETLALSRAKSLFVDDDEGIEDEDYFENYDMEPQGSRIRAVDDVGRIGRRVSKMATRIETLESSVYRIGNESATFKALLQQPSPGGIVAFSAGLSSDFTCCGVVVFDNVFINNGNGYDASSGKFTATSNGIYVFFVSIAERNSFVRGALVQNGMSLITVQLDHSNGNYEQSQSSNSIILYLPEGSHVWFQIFTGTLQCYQSPTVTFSGFLISALN